MRIGELVLQTIDENRKTMAKYISKDNAQYMAMLATVIDFEMRMQDAIRKKNADAYSLNRVGKDIAKAYFIEYCEKRGEKYMNLNN